MLFTNYFNLMGMAVIATSGICLFAQYNHSVLFRFRENAGLIALLASAFLTNIFDYIANSMIRNPRYDEAYYIAAYTFLIFTFFSAMIFSYCFVSYIFDQTGGRINKILLAIPPAVLMFVALAFNHQSGIFFTLDRSTFTHRHSPLIYAVHILFGVYILIAAVECYRKRSYMSETKNLALLFTFTFCSATLIISVFTKYVHGFVAGNVGTAVGILILIFHIVDRTVNQLTGLKNENGFASKGKYLLDTSPDKLVFAFISVYHLRLLNERFGYKTGNIFLAKYAELLINQYRSVPSVLGRFDSGFAVLVRERDFKMTGEKINLQEFLGSAKYEDYTVTLYCGVCPVNDKNIPIWKILKRAYYALATVHGNFQNHIAWFRGDIEKCYENERTIEHKINTSIDMAEFHVVLQPIIDTQTGKVCSAEALVRWHNKELGAVSPDKFIPIFEKMGFIAKLDKYMLESVCDLIADIKKRGIKPAPVSINISRTDIENEKLADEIMSIVDAHGVEHSLIKIEITESAFNDKDAVLKNTINRLRNAGFLVLMDDFGSGYSNLAMFQRVSCDIIKLDMKFLHDVGYSDKSNAVFKAIVRFTKDLRLPMVVEGVETKEQYEFVKALGCDMIQGYYFSKPLPYEEFVKMLE